MQDAALIIASPWPRTGSANIFAAQSLYLASRNFRTAMLLSPHTTHHRSRFERFWAFALSAMRFEGTDVLCHSTTNRRARRWRSLSFFQWLMHGRDSQLTIMARYAAAAALPKELMSFLDANVLRIVVVNHCFQMLVAENICQHLERHGRPRPVVVLETHDIQADLYARGKIENVFRNKPDNWQTLARDELRLAAAADILMHVGMHDIQHFRDRLPGKHHLIPATLHPETEKRFEQPRKTGGERFDFLYVGNNNPGNEMSIRWFLTEVVPLLDSSYSIAIVGSIGEHLKAIEPELFNRYRSFFRGEVEDVVTFYGNAAVIVIPTQFGTGTSIKSIEALAAGKPIIATQAALRGLPLSPDSDAIIVADKPAIFAKAMIDAHHRQTQKSSNSRDYYLDNLSNARYFERWDEVLAEILRPSTD